MPTQRRSNRRRQHSDGIVELVSHFVAQWVTNHIPLVLAFVGSWWLAAYMTARIGGRLGFLGLAFGGLGLAAKFLCDWLVWSIRQRALYADVGTHPPSFAVQRRKFHEERRRRADIRRQWVTAAQRYEITDPDKMVPHLWRLRTDLAGDFSCSVYPAKLVLKGGVEQVELSRKKIAQAVDCRDLLVRRKANGFELTFMWSDPLEGLLKVADCPPVPRSGLVSFGRTITGTAAVLELNLHLLVVGMTRKGKSSTIHAINADLQRQEVRVNLSIIDPKGGVEMDAYEPHEGVLNGSLLVRDYCPTGDIESAETLRRVIERMRERQAIFKERGIRKWTPDMNAEFPLEVLFVDECLQVLRKWAKMRLGDDKTMGGAMNMLCDELLAQGAGVGFVFWALSQSGKVEDMHGARDLIPQRFCLGVSNLDAARMALGENTPGIDRAVGLEPGRGLLYLEHEEGLTEVRVAYCDDADVRTIAAGKAKTLFRLVKSQVDRLCYVYLLRDRLWRAVYVGKGFVPEGRIAHHLAGTGQLSAAEAAAVDESKTDIFTFNSEAEALAWEKELIHRCRPVANKVHNGANPAAGRLPSSQPPWMEQPPLEVVRPQRRWGRSERRAALVQPVPVRVRSRPVDDYTRTTTTRTRKA